MRLLMLHTPIMRGGVVLMLLGVASCTRPNPAATCSEGSCSDPEFGFCDVDGAVSGTPNSCIAIDCVPGEVVACRGDQTLVCNAAGDDLDVTPCGFGACTATPVAHCPYLEPKFLPDICDVPATDELAFTNSASFDTDLDINCTGGTLTQGLGPEICVVRASSIEIPTGVELTVVGSRVVAFVADSLVDIEGVLDVSADGTRNGPGGGVIRSGGNESCFHAGGGAGFKTAGGAGGDNTSDGGGAPGGQAEPNPADGFALAGGTRPSGTDPPNSGGAGGGLSLIACRGEVRVAGTIDAGGGGGIGGFLFPNLCAVGATGGGSGGTVVLQGLSVSVSGEIYANGGSGGAGRPSSQNQGNPGRDGLRSMVIATGGASQGQGDGAGGHGGALTSVPTRGLRSTDPMASAGGGGGSVGFLQVFTPTNEEPNLTPQGISPPFEPNLNVPTR